MYVIYSSFIPMYNKLTICFVLVNSLNFDLFFNFFTTSIPRYLVYIRGAQDKTTESLV